MDQIPPGHQPLRVNQVSLSKFLVDAENIVLSTDEILIKTM